MELKEQIIQELNEQKQKEQEQRKLVFSSLIPINFYCRPGNPNCDGYRDFFKDNGIKFEEKDLGNHPEIMSTVQMNLVPIIEVNDIFLVVGRDFSSPQALSQKLPHIASSQWKKSISPEAEILETLKNLKHMLNRSFQQLNKNLAPITKVMNQMILEENNKSKAPKSAKKNK